MVAARELEVLAIVQARGGSKSLPRKNIRPLAGHPLVSYSIAAGLAAQTVTRLIVSTDDEEIAEVSGQYGAEVPFLRPAELAQDDTPDLPLFQHALEWLEEHEGYRPHVVVQLRPTSPLRPVGLVDKAVEKLISRPEADCVRGVTMPSQNPYKMWRMQSDGSLEPLLATEFDEPYNMPRQRLPRTYWQTGHIDAIRCETIVTKCTLTGDRVLPLLIDRSYCVDIDTLEEWAFAEWLVESGHVTVVQPVQQPSAPPAAQRKKWQGLPRRVDLLVLDFDGVLTDNRVWVLEDGREAVACHRGDGMGLSLLRQRGIPVLVLSTETNPVVSERCRKLGIECVQGLGQDKFFALRQLLAARAIELSHVVYMGNDVNDLECMEAAGCGVSVADAHPEVLRAADLVLSAQGGQGAVRELCDRLLNRGGIS